MVDGESAQGELLIDWDNLLENIPDDLNFDFSDQPTADLFSGSPESGGSLSVDDIVQYLMNDDPGHPEEKDENIVIDEFFSDVFLDSSTASESDRSKDSSTSPESGEVGADQENKEESKLHQSCGDFDVPQTKDDCVVDVTDDDENDPSAKKRKRQMRNRDAAVRSRERKKMYVKDLEMKSKYYEAECKRLGILLQCCVAENQALRLSLHNTKAYDPSMTKQESAVLVMESLLLGSLLGFLGIICLLLLPNHLLSMGLLENVDSVEWEGVLPKKAKSNIFTIPFHSFMISKRCKASRSRMKLTASTMKLVM